MGAVMFLLHPLQVQTVGWISLGDNSLSVCFALGALLLYLRNISNRATFPNSLPKTFWVATVLFFLGLASKATVLVLPALVVVMERTVWKHPWNRIFSRALLTWGWLVLPFIVLTKQLQPNGQMEFVAPVWVRPLVALDAIAFYLSKIAVPFSLAIDYGRSPKWVMENPRLWIWCLLAGAVVLAAWRLRKREPLLWTAVLWLLISISPVLGLVPFSFQMYSTVASHYIYLGMLGVALLFSTFVIRPHCLVPALVVTLLVALQSSRAISNWKNDETAFGSSLETNPSSFLAHNNLGVYYQQQGQFEKSAHHFSKAIAITPWRAALYSNLGAALAALGQEKAALDAFKKALEKDPTLRHAQLNMEKLKAKRDP